MDVQASAVITGGLFALLPGRALVAGVQDGLTGFYITASARLLEVMYFFVGIVVGVLLVLYFGVQLGAELNPDAALSIVERPLCADRRRRCCCRWPSRCCFSRNDPPCWR